MLHDPKVQTEPFSYPDVNEWWRGKGVCINGSWRKFQKALEAENNKKQHTKNSSDKPDDASKSADEHIDVLKSTDNEKISEEEAKPPAKLP